MVYKYFPGGMLEYKECQKGAKCKDISGSKMFS